MRNVYVADTITDAGVIRNLLVEHGIECRLVEKATARYMAGATEVWVLDDERESEAVELIRRVMSRPVDERDWLCRKCKAANPATFESCWSCGARRPQLED